MIFGSMREACSYRDWFLQTNRLAKLKQSKLDVRREQWLSRGISLTLFQFYIILAF